MKKYPFFLESELGRPSPENSFFHVISAPLEKSVSYGKGTARGPEAIIRASGQLELFDGHGNPSELGIYTHPPLKMKGSMAKSLGLIEELVSGVIAKDKIPVILGGEHSLTAAVVQGIRKHTDSFGVIQFDAHADLRESYEGSFYSHACVMRRIFDMHLPFLQIGIRSCSPGEADFIKTRKLTIIPPGDFVDISGILNRLPDKIYITFDVDGWDPAIMPSTGTPEPGGLDWFQTIKYLETIFRKKKVIGFDLVELSPIKGLHAPDFMTARLAYQMMGMKTRGR